MEAPGIDSDGHVFENAAEMWRDFIGEPDSTGSHKLVDWYRNGVGYWQDVEASVEGVLGGFGSVNDADINTSEVFLRTLFSELCIGNDRNLVCLDCGCGIGRVTKNLLIRYFNETDLLEPVSHFLEAARQSLAPEGLATVDEHKAVNFYCAPLQEFIPEPGRYDVIWIQWCIGHLTDDHFISFFKSAKVGLKPGGFFILKENLARNGFVLDKADSSITRSEEYFKELFRKCGLHVYKVKAQTGFPKNLFHVKMFALMTELPKRRNPPRSKSRANTANRPGRIK